MEVSFINGQVQVVTAEFLGNNTGEGSEDLMWRELQDSKKIGIRIVAIYSLISCLWIISSDYILVYSGLPPYKWIDTAKGWLFVMVNGFFLYRLIQRNVLKVQEKELRYRTLVENSFEAVLILIDHKIAYINKVGLNLLGAKDKHDVVGKSIFHFVHSSDKSRMMEQMNKVKTDNKIFMGKYVRLNGEEIYGESVRFPIKFRGVAAIQVLLRDITERKRAEEKIHQLAYYDQLTGLPNRNLLNQELERLLDEADHRQHGAVLFIDMDRFKTINDTLGHQMGDLMLIEVSKRLRKCVDEGGVVSRMGGDEFVIILPGSNVQEAEKVAQCLIHSFITPMLLDGVDCFSTPSIGISMYPSDGKDAASLIKYADSAMYLAKREGRNNYQFYQKEWNVESLHNSTIEKGLRRAVEEDEFELWYQPQVDLLTGKVIGVEALIRWHHPQLGMIMPVQFIPLAEEANLISRIGCWVLKSACRQLKSWHERGLNELAVSVNISPRQFQDPNFIASVISVLEETGLEPGCLHLEITESVLQNIKKSAFILSELKKMGVNISIDDFGVGYSSLGVLKQLPIDSLKIDKCFIDDVNTREEVILKTILHMGNSLQLHVIAEGIENEEQLAFLKAHHCPSGQGYLFSKPLPAQEAERWLAAKGNGTV
jgi:diguanylate cyclase (GGDEF)-like protein/PAS domain S-box-containing protein